MKMENTTGCPFTAASAGSITRDQLTESRRQMEQEFSVLLRADTPLRWHGSQADLMELIYLVYANGNFRDADGYPLSMAELTRRTCHVFGLALPHNPYELAARAMRRKGQRRQRLLDRYAWLYCVAGVKHPLSNIVRRGCTSERRSS